MAHTAKPGILRNVDVGKLLDLHSFSGVLFINHNHNAALGTVPRGMYLLGIEGYQLSTLSLIYPRSEREARRQGGRISAKPTGISVKRRKRDAGNKP